MTVLLNAVIQNDLPACLQAIHDGADVNEVATIEHRAVVSRLEKVVSVYHGTALFVAAALGHAGLVGALLQKKADHSIVCSCTETGEKAEVTYKRGVIEGTPLFIATTKGKWEAMQALLEAGADFTVIGKHPLLKGYVLASEEMATPLQVASEDIYKPLLQWITHHMTATQWLAVFNEHDSKKHGHLSTFEAKKLLQTYQVDIKDAELNNYKTGKKFTFQEFCKLWVKHGCQHQAIIEAAENPPTSPPPAASAGSGSFRRSSGAGTAAPTSPTMKRMGSGSPSSPTQVVLGLERRGSAGALQNKRTVGSPPTRTASPPSIANRTISPTSLAARKVSSPTATTAHRTIGSPTAARTTSPTVTRTTSPIAARLAGTRPPVKHT